MKTTREQRLVDSKVIMRELILAPFLTGVAVTAGLTIVTAGVFASILLLWLH